MQSFDNNLNTHYDDCITPAGDSERPRQCPLPAFSWANAYDVWQLMCKKDEQSAYLRDSNMLDRHPDLQPRMRTIVLDWLIEVCELSKLQRETYYLAVDYFDRYLSTQRKVQQTQLQLIGITCLYVAAKVEENCPPVVDIFVFATDGACQASVILKQEIILLRALEWSINPVTPIGWLGVYIQLNVNHSTPVSFQTSSNLRGNNSNSNKTNKTVNTKPISKQDKQLESSACSSNLLAPDKAATHDRKVNDTFIYPQFSGFEFVQTAQLLDLCSLDIGMVNFPYSILAAAAISHTFNRETALRCSGFNWETLQPCVRWMQPFFGVITDESNNLQLIDVDEELDRSFGLVHICPNIVTDDSHLIQTHNTSMTMFDSVCHIKELLLAIETTTPPASSPKLMGIIDDNDEDDDENDNEQTHETTN